MIILYIIIFLVIFFLIKGIITRIYYLHRFSKTYDELDNMGHINTVSGKIGAGKSILCSAFTQLLTFKIIDRLEETMEEIETILIEINFMYVENLIHKHKLTIDNLDVKFNDLLSEYEYSDDLENIKLTNNLANVYFDFINYKDRTKLLKRWIECYLHLDRDSYVFSNVRLFNHVTASYAYEFKNEYIHLKVNALEKKDFPLMKNSIFFEDDKSLYSNNLQALKKAYEDTGSDTFMRLFRHLFEEQAYYLVSLQDVDRWLKHEREISTNHIFVESSFVVGEFQLLNTLLNILEKASNIVLWILKRFYKNERYYSNNNRFKRFIYKLDLIRKYLFSKTYLNVKCSVYQDIEDVGKEIDKNSKHAYNFSYIAPIYYFFGNLNSHEFNEVYKYVYSNSTTKFGDLKEFLFDKERAAKVLGIEDTEVKTNTENVVNIF